MIIEINDKNCKVNVGLKSPVEIVKEDHKLKDRVTVRLKTDKNGQVNAKKISKKRAKRELGYFGYSLRLANDVKDAIKNGPFKKCYDLTIGTSERGEDIAAVSRNSNLQFRYPAWYNDFYRNLLNILCLFNYFWHFRFFFNFLSKN